MARKTNKTEHVLSLLSGTDAAVEKEEVKAGPQETAGMDKGTPPPAAHQGNVHVVLAAAKDGDPVAEIIKEKLEEELAEEEAAGRMGSAEPDLQDTALGQLPEAGVSDGEAETPDTESGIPDTGSQITDTGSQTPDIGSQIPDTEIPGTKPETDRALPANEPVDPDEMEGYLFYNIMEKIVQAKAMKYMKQFGNCTCRRCEADTIALALSKLPPKYVVVKEDSISPLLNFYEDHFAGQIIVEITKACIVVNKNPRHHRD